MFPVQTSVPVRHPALAVWILIAANAAVFMFEAALPPPALDTVIHALGNVPARFADGADAGDVSTLLTAMFLHGGWFHLVGNMWTLWLFGRAVEDRMGHARFTAFYLACGVLSGVAHVVMTPGSPVPAVGASGAIAGVMGAYLAMFPLSRILMVFPLLFLPLFFEISALFYLAWWFVVQFFSGLVSIIAVPRGGGIAFWAHVGGFAVGVAAHRAFLRPRRERRPLQRDEIFMGIPWDV